MIHITLMIICIIYTQRSYSVGKGINNILFLAEVSELLHKFKVIT